MNRMVLEAPRSVLTFKELMTRFEQCTSDMYSQEELNITNKIMADHFPELSPLERHHLLAEYLHHESNASGDDLSNLYSACKGLLGDRLSDKEI